MYPWSVFIHVLIAMFWIGGMLFTAAILVPATRHRLAGMRGLLFTELGRRFSRLTWLMFPLLILTGYTALLSKGHTTEQLMSVTFWATPYGTLLGGKLSLFGAVLILSGLHDFWLGPKAAELMDRREEDDEPAGRTAWRYRMASSWIGRINLLLGLVIVFLAVSLVR